jgi:hypothetical protein
MSTTFRIDGPQGVTIDAVTTDFVNGATNIVRNLVVSNPGDMIYASTPFPTATLSALPIGSIGDVLTVSAGSLPVWSPAATSVTSVSVSSANGFSGTVATPTTTPDISISTTVTGVLHGFGGVVSTALNSQLPVMSATVGGAVPTPPNVATQYLDGTGNWTIPAGTGVTSVSVTPANGFSGTVATPTTTPAITLGTTLTEGVVYTSTLVPSNILSTAGLGSSGQALTSTGVSSAPTWTTIDPLTLTVNTPSTPAANTVTIFRRDIAGRQMAGFIEPTGYNSPLQPFIGTRKIASWNPPGNSTTVPGIFGISTLTSTGTVAARNQTTTNLFNRSRRLGFTSAALAGSLAGIRSGVGAYTTGDGAGLGGFTIVMTFGFSIAISATQRAFIGIRQSIAAPANAEPSTLTNCCGVGRGAADTNLSIFYGGTFAQAPIPLGANFPANTINTDWYELILFSPANVTGVINYQVTRLNTGDVATGQLSGIATVIPPANLLLTPINSYVTNNATAVSVGLDHGPIYIETNY